MIPTEYPTANPISQTDAEAQGNLLREYEQKFAELPEQQKLTKLCSDVGFLKNIDKTILHYYSRPNQFERFREFLELISRFEFDFFITLDEEGLDDLKTLCRENTLPRNEEASRARGWIRGNTKIGPVLDVKVYFHQGRYGVDVMIESLFRDRTVSWVRIVNGIDKYVTETSEEISIESDEHGRRETCREG